MLRDWLANGSLRQEHSCGALVVALGSLSYWHAGYSTVFSDIRNASKSVCTTRPAFSRISVGMSNAAVAAAAGMPRRVGPQCWLYSARRVCFTGGRVSLVQYVTHG